MAARAVNCFTIKGNLGSECTILHYAEVNNRCQDGPVPDSRYLCWRRLLMTETAGMRCLSRN